MSWEDNEGSLFASASNERTPETVGEKKKQFGIGHNPTSFSNSTKETGMGFAKRALSQGRGNNGRVGGGDSMITTVSAARVTIKPGQYLSVNQPNQNTNKPQRPLELDSFSRTSLEARPLSAQKGQLSLEAKGSSNYALQDIHQNQRNRGRSSNSNEVVDLLSDDEDEEVQEVEYLSGPGGSEVKLALLRLLLCLLYRPCFFQLHC